MDNLEISLDATLDKDHGKTGGDLVDSFIKTRVSTIFGQPGYSMDGTEPSVVVLGKHEEFFNSYFGIWICGNIFHMDDVDQ